MSVTTVDTAADANNRYTQRSAFFDGNLMGKFFASDIFFNIDTWDIKEYKYEDNDDPEIATPYYLISGSLSGEGDGDNIFYNFIICTAIFHKKINDKDNDTTKRLWQNVYAKWNSLDGHTQLFYQKFMTPYSNDNEVTMNNSNIDYIGGNSIKINTDEFKKTVPNAHNIKYFTERYESILNHDAGAEKKCDEQNDKQFYKLIDKIVKKRLAFIRDEITVGDAIDKENDQEEINVKATNTWTKQGDVYSKSNAEIKEIPVEKCYTTGIQTKDENKTACREYIVKCLTSTSKIDADACKLSDAEFFDAAKDDIDSMHPLIALRTLEKFGFKKIKIHDDTAKKELIKIQSVEGWKKNANDDKKMSDKEKTQISEKLLNYLIMVVTHVNSNPQILNSDYTGQSDEITEKNSLAQIQSRVDTPNNNQITHAIQHRKPIIDPMIIIRAQELFEANTKLTMDAINDKNTNKTPNSEYLATKFFDMDKKMKADGKEISSNDRISILNMLKRMEEIESELIKTLRYIISYNNMYKISGDTRSSKTLSLSNLKSIVERHEKLRNKYRIEENSMEQVIAAIEGIINDAISSNVMEVYD